MPELSLVERVRLDFDTFIEQHRCLWVEKKHHHIIKQEKSIYIKTKATIVSMLLLPLFWPVKICDDFALKSQLQSFSIVLNRKPVWVLHKLTAAASTSIADNNNECMARGTWTVTTQQIVRQNLHFSALSISTRCDVNHTWRDHHQSRLHTVCGVEFIMKIIIIFCKCVVHDVKQEQRINGYLLKKSIFHDWITFAL